MTTEEEIKRQARLAKIQIWNANPAQSAVMQAMERALLSLNVQELREAIKSATTDTKANKATASKIECAIKDLTATISAHTDLFTEYQKIYAELRERSSAVEKSVEALAKANDELLKRVSELRNSELEALERTDSEMGDMRLRMGDLDAKLADISKLVGARQKMLEPYLARKAAKEKAQAPTIPAEQPVGHQTDTRKLRSGIQYTMPDYLPATPSAGQSQVETQPLPNARQLNRQSKEIRAFWKRVAICEKELRSGKIRNVTKMIWSLLEAQGSAMSTFLQNHLLQRCDDVKKISKARKGRSGCVRFVNVDKVVFEDLVKALRHKSFDIGSQQTMLDVGSPDQCSAPACPQEG